MLNLQNLPKTVGLIMDGNGRWAQQRNSPRTEGHTAGIRKMIELAIHAFHCGVNNVVCYGLSTENLNRPKQEVEHIYKLVIDIFDTFTALFRQERACVKYVGNLNSLPAPVLASINRAEETLKEFENCGRTLYVAIAYGSRSEIVRAVNTAVERGIFVTEQDFLSLLDFPTEPELIIRTGGERRLSNFLLYQASYAELYFSDKLFPDFTKEDFDSALEWFSERKRRHGLI